MLVQITKQRRLRIVVPKALLLRMLRTFKHRYVPFHLRMSHNH